MVVISETARGDGDWEECGEIGVAIGAVAEGGGSENPIGC